jgi:hypothetical protein
VIKSIDMEKLRHYPKYYYYNPADSKILHEKLPSFVSASFTFSRSVY